MLHTMLFEKVSNCNVPKRLTVNTYNFQDVTNYSCLKVVGNCVVPNMLAIKNSKNVTKHSLTNVSNGKV